MSGINITVFDGKSTQEAAQQAIAARDTVLGAINGVKGSIAPTDPAPTEDGVYKANRSGTYPNIGGLIAKDGYATYFERKGTVWTVYSEDRSKGDPGKDSNVEDWSELKTYTWVNTADQFVLHQGRMWAIAKDQVATAMDIPGSSIKWIEKTKITEVSSSTGNSTSVAASQKLVTEMLVSHETLSVDPTLAPTSTGSTVGSTIINLRKPFLNRGKLFSVQINTGIAGSSFKLVHFRLQAGVYNEYKTYDVVTPLLGLNTIDLTSLSETVFANDMFALRVISGNVRIRQDAAHNDYGFLSTTAAAPITWTEAQLNGFNGRDTIILYNVTISFERFSQLGDRVDQINTGVEDINVDISEVKTEVGNLSIKTEKVDELVTAVSVPISSYDFQNESGFNSTSFKGWAFGIKTVRALTGIRMHLGQLGASVKITLEVYRRSVANENLVGAIYFPGLVNGDTLIRSINFNTAELGTGTDLTNCLLEFPKIDEEAERLVLFVLKAYDSADNLVQLGTDRTTTIGSSLKQYERGWYVNASGQNAAIASGSNFSMSRIVYGEEYSNLTGQTKQAIQDTNARIDYITAPKLARGRILFTERFTSIGSHLINNGWSASSDGITPTTTGLANYVMLDRQYSLERRNCRTTVRLGSTTRFMLFTIAKEGNVNQGTIGEVDCSTGKIRIYKAFNGTALPAVAAEAEFAFVSGRDYIVELHVNKRELRQKLTITDSLTGDSWNVQDITNTAGRQHDCYAMCCYAGTFPVVRDIMISVSGSESEFETLFFSDSIGEALGNGVTANNGYAQMLTANGKGLVSGRGGGNIDGVIRRLETEALFIRPKRIIITIGTNDGNTLAKLRQMVRRSLEIGAIVILNNIPMRGNQDVAARNSDIETVRGEFGLRGIKLDVATALNNDLSQGYDPAKFYSDMVHPINFGGGDTPFMFNRCKIDLPELIM